VKEQHFLGSGVLAKQLRSQRKGMEDERERAGWGGGSQESKVCAKNAPQSESQHQMLGKALLTKKAQEKSLTSIEKSLMAGPNCQAGQGKESAAANLARHGSYRRGRLRKSVHAQ
jgi:hypothetical protein